jgi:hypothetical protein
MEAGLGNFRWARIGAFKKKGDNFHHPLLLSFLVELRGIEPLTS